MCCSNQHAGSLQPENYNDHQEIVNNIPSELLHLLKLQTRTSELLSTLYIEWK